MSFLHPLCVCVYIYNFFLTIIIVNLFLNSFPLSPRNFLGPLIKILSSIYQIENRLPKNRLFHFYQLKILYPKNRLLQFYQLEKKFIKNSSIPILPNGKKTSIQGLFWTIQQWHSCTGTFYVDINVFWYPSKPILKSHLMMTRITLADEII